MARWTVSGDGCVVTIESERGRVSIIVEPEGPFVANTEVMERVRTLLGTAIADSRKTDDEQP